MLFLRPLFPVLLLALALTPAASDARLCLRLLQGGGPGRISANHGVELTAQEEALFIAWLKRHRFYLERVALLSEETLGMILNELPDGLRPKVIRAHEEMQPFFTARRMVLEGYPIYSRLLDYYAWPGTPRILRAEARVAKYRALSDAEKREVAKIYDHIREVGQIKEVLLRTEQPEYRLKFDPEWVTFPDGARYRYERLIWGQIRIWVRFKNILRTQTVIYPDTLSRYRNSARTVGTGLSEIMGPDGRVLLYDGHHRVLAYAMANHVAGSIGEARVPFILRRSADGHYYSVPHFRILHSPNYVDLPATRRKWEHDTTWSFLETEEDRELFLRHCLLRPRETFREIYYRETQLAPLGDED